MFKLHEPLLVLTLVLRPWTMRALQLPLTVVRMTVCFRGTLVNRGDLKFRLMLPDLAESLRVGERVDRGLRMSSSESWIVTEMEPELVEKSIRS